MYIIRTYKLHGPFVKRTKSELRVTCTVRINRQVSTRLVKCVLYVRQSVSAK